MRTQVFVSSRKVQRGECHRHPLLGFNVSCTSEASHRPALASKAGVPSSPPLARAAQLDLVLRTGGRGEGDNKGRAARLDRLEMARHLTYVPCVQEGGDADVLCE